MTSNTWRAALCCMWYLGSWYEPADLKRHFARPATFEFPRTLFRPKAYTQGWALAVAQAHPMGYSELQFGYWTPSRADPRQALDFIAGNRLPEEPSHGRHQLHECDVAIVGSGFAGALIANELGEAHKRSLSSRPAKAFSPTQQ